MAAAALVLKIKTGGAQSVVRDLTAASTLADLASKVAALSGIEKSRLKLLAGFPPRALGLETAGGGTTLSEAGVKSGDVIMAEQLPEAPPPPPPQPDAAYYSEPPPGAGMLMRHVVPSDNSCLFTSINFVLNNGKVETGNSSSLRGIIAEKVLNDPENFNEAILGKPPAEYCAWIRRPETWGGAIELSVLSSFYGFEIVVVNSLHGIVNRFGEDQKYATRAFLIYDGIHYDPLYLEPYDGSANVTQFASSNAQVLEQALELAQESKSSRQFTDVQQFSIKCLQCQVVLKGQVAAQQHAKDTGHLSFGEV